MPSKINVFIVVGLKNGDDVWGGCSDAMPAIASASLLIGLLESELCLCGVCSTNGNVLSGEMCLVIIWG